MGCACVPRLHLQIRPVRRSRRRRFVRNQGRIVMGYGGMDMMGVNWIQIGYLDGHNKRAVFLW